MAGIAAAKPVFEVLATTAQVVAVVVGVVLSVKTYSAGQEKDAEARKLEAAKPFLELRQKLYLEAVHAAGVLTSPALHTAEELATSKKRFRELYVAELSMVESTGVEFQMKALAQLIDKEVTNFTPEQRAAYDLAHKLRDSFVESWDVKR